MVALSRPITFTLECRTSRSTPSGVLHEVTLEPGWQLRTPHDLDAEGVAAAFGGYTSCLELDAALSAAREGLRLLQRRVTLPITCNAKGSWRMTATQHCCRGRRFHHPGIAARHLRDPAHLARRFRARDWQVARLLAVVDRELGPFAAPPPEGWAVAERIRESDGLDRLWEAGVHPDAVAEMADVASAVVDPLPLWYYLGVAYGGADREWLRATLAHRPDPDVASWLAWTRPDREASSPDDWGRWLSLGLSRYEVTAVLEAGVAPEAAHVVADRAGVAPPFAARIVAAWAVSGCRIGPDHVVTLQAAGLADHRPSASAIDALADDVRALGHELDRTELAVILALTGTRRVAADYILNRGVRRVADLLV